MVSIWSYKNENFKPLDRNKVMHWAQSVRIFILDQNDDYPNIIDAKLGDDTYVTRAILRGYHNDLDFPTPRGFSPQPWLDRGIHMEKIQGIQTFQRIRAVSLLRERCVFHLWGSTANQLFPVIEPDRGHLVVRCDYPTDRKTNRSFEYAQPFSKTCDYLDVSREIWRL